MEVIDSAKLKSVELVPGYHAKIVQSENMSIVLWKIFAGYKMPEHSHPHEQITHILSGDFEITINKETKALTGGSIIVVPPGVKHYGRSLSDCEIIDTFYPAREDYSVYAKKFETPL